MKTNASETDRVILRSGNAVLSVNPPLGGSLSSFRVDGFDILRPQASASTEITDAGSFPLIPIVNRIPDGQFEFEGKQVDLEGNFLGLPDFIHGHGWRADWTIKAQAADRLTLAFTHQPDAWPWAYRGEQVIEVRADGFRHTLSVQNLSASNMPAALGFHPYFPTTSQTRLFANFEGHWISNELGHAIARQDGATRKDFRNGADLIDPEMLDATHYGWDGVAKLVEPARPEITITASAACRNMHVFFPPNGDFAAIEPTTGRSNPFNVGPVEYETLAPGQRFEIWMDVSVAQGSTASPNRSG